MRTLFSYGILIVGILIALLRLQPPAPLPATAPLSEFSATRALADIRVMAESPHPVGTAAHDRVRDYLVGRLKAMGLNPALHADRSIVDRWPGWIDSAPVTNIVATLPGKDRSKPAVLVMSHYDGVPNSPAAADDGAGVSTTLEIARALKAGPQPDRDVVFLVTDGEELGLNGATAFFERDPLVHHIGAVINFEARGDGGLAAMFETGPRNAEAVAAYTAKAPRPSANSLARAIYKRMPNGSDFTLAIDRGLPGVNIAFIGDEAAYHSPLATAAHLDLGSLQHMGGQGLAAARAFAAEIPAQSADSVYSDVLGLFFVQYSFAVSWVLYALAALLALYAVWVAVHKTDLAWGRGVAGAFLLILGPALVLWTAGRAFNGLDHFQRLAHFDFLLAGAALLTIGAVALVIAAVETGRGRIALMGAAAVLAVLASAPGFDPVALVLAVLVIGLCWPAIREDRRPAALWHSVLLLVLILAGITQALVPEAAFVLVWPLTAAAIVAAVRISMERGHWAGALLAGIAAILVFAQTAYAAASIFTAVGVDMPVVLVLPLISALPILLLLPGQHRLPIAVHAAIVLAGVVVFAYGRWAPPAAERPQPSEVRSVQDLDTGKAYRIATFSPLDAWESAALGTAKYEALPWNSERKLWWAPAKPFAAPPSAISVRRDGDRVVVAVKAAQGAYSASLELRPLAALKEIELDGRRLKTTIAPGRFSEVRAYVPGEGFVFSFAAPPHGKIDLRLTTTDLTWPSDAEPLPPLPAGRMAFDRSGSTQTVTRKTFSW